MHAPHPLLELRLVRNQSFDLRVLHGERVAEPGAQKAAIAFFAPHSPFRNDHIVLFDHARNGYGRTAQKLVIFYLFVEGFFSDQFARDRLS
jgi:hypothetical protein